MTRALAGLLVGRTLADRYEIEELIGRGGMSLVYRATDRRLHRPVAVKVISLPSDSDQQHLQLRERLRREAAAAARVPPHPNVVQVYDYGTDHELDLDFIAMELLDGRDLKAMLAEGSVPYGEAIRILREAARGLAAGHRAGVIHRDVKPANIVVTSDRPGGTVKLLDFGIAKALESALEDDLTRTGQAPHSPAYASPEQMRPGEPVTAASDVYQLGLVAHEMLCGERALDGVASRGERWAAVPEGVRQVVECAMRPLPEERYRDAAGFAEALSRAAFPEDGTMLMPPEPAPEPRAAPPPPPLPPPVPPRPAVDTEVAAHRDAAPPLSRKWRPHRLLLWAGLVLVVLLVVRALTLDDDPPATPDSLAPEVEALDEQFRGLLEEAYENLEEMEAEEGAADDEASGR
ncbi:MAG TPA: serine/threonine-protein kinase [Longimicrobiaceae bacterium]